MYLGYYKTCVKGMQEVKTAFRRIRQIHDVGRATITILRIYAYARRH